MSKYLEFSKRLRKISDLASNTKADMVSTFFPKRKNFEEKIANPEFASDAYYNEFSSMKVLNQRGGTCKIYAFVRMCVRLIKICLPAHFRIRDKNIDTCDIDYDSFIQNPTQLLETDKKMAECNVPEKIKDYAVFTFLMNYFFSWHENGFLNYFRLIHFPKSVYANTFILI